MSNYQQHPQMIIQAPINEIVCDENMQNQLMDRMMANLRNQQVRGPVMQQKINELNQAYERKCHHIQHQVRPGEHVNVQLQPQQELHIKIKNDREFNKIDKILLQYIKVFGPLIVIICVCFISFMPILAILNSKSLKEFYEKKDKDSKEDPDNKDKILSESDYSIWNVASISYICTIIFFTFLALVILFSIIIMNNNNKFVKFLLFMSMIISVISYIISIPCSIAVAAINIKMFHSNNDKNTELVLSSIYLAIIGIGIISNIIILIKKNK
jgi:hypothetical protein